MDPIDWTILGHDPNPILDEFPVRMKRRPVPQLPPGTNGLWRDPALRPLSSEHHDVLVQALFLKRAARAADEALGGARKAARTFLDFHRDVMRGHEDDEEQVVLPLAGHADPEGAARIREEHAELEAALVALRAALEAGTDPRALLGEIGQALDDHVRFEERAFFMAIQAVLPAEEMAALGQALLDRRTGRGVAPGCAIRG